MPIYDDPTPTAAAVLFQERARRRARRLIDILEQEYNLALSGVFNNDLGLTPQQAADAFATDAEDYFRLYGAVRTLLTTRTNRNPPAPSEYGTVTYDGDGTVTVTVPEPPPEP